jgi:serine protease Do
MAPSDVAGLKLTAVRPGSPGDVAGLKAGDIIVELGGVAVKDIYTYSDALYSHQPGDVVKIVVVRAGERVEVTAKVGKR